MQVAWFGSTNNRAHERGNNEDQATSLLTLNNTTIGAGLPPAPGAVPQQTTTSKAKSGATTAESTVDFKADVAGAVLLPPKPGGGAGNYVIKDRVYGQINATPLTIDKTYASGVSEVKFRELVMRSGVWKPRTSWRTTLKGSSAVVSGGITDPFDVSIINLDTMEAMNDRLFSMDVYLDGGGEAAWEDGHFILDGINGKISIDLGSQFLDPLKHGHLDLNFSKGLISSLNATGAFSGLFPSIGAASTFDIDLIAAGILDSDGAFLFEINGPTPANGWEFNGDWSTRGFVAQAVPEPSTFILLVSGLSGVIVLRGLLNMSRCRPDN